MLTRRLILAIALCAVSSCLGPQGSPPRPEASPTVRVERADLLAVAGAVESLWLERPRFDRCVVSWNADRNARFELDLQVAHGAERSPWIPVLAWPDAERFTTGGGGEGYGAIDVDEFRAVEGRSFDALRLRFRGASVGLAGLARAFVCTSLGDSVEAGPAPRRRVTVELPPRSQHALPAPLGPRLCSPTSVSMALAAAGREPPLATLAARILDRRHALYGNWPRAVAAAAELGLPGCVTRIQGWPELERWLERGATVVASITVEPGELRGAPFEATRGHLLVVRGLDGAGGVLVHDPAAPARASVPRRYDIEEFARVWFERKGGTAYLFGDAVLSSVPEQTGSTAP